MNSSVELQRRQKVDQVTATPITVVVMAGPAERAAIARRLELQDVAALEAECRLDRLPASEGVRLRGRVHAKITQTCVVTLEPMPVEVVTEFERIYLPEWTPELEDLTETVDSEAPDVEALVDDTIELGEAVVEELSLALDPYPRLPGVELDQHDEAGRPSPFQALSVLRQS